MRAPPSAGADTFPLGEAASEVREGAETDRLCNIGYRHLRVTLQELGGHFQTEFIQRSNECFSFLFLVESAEGRPVHSHIGGDLLYGDGPGVVATDIDADLFQALFGNAPVLQMTTREQYFSFVVKTDFTQSHQRFDQCGVVMYLDSDNWLKGSVEFENEEFQHLGSVATNNGYSDWATTAIPADVKTMWYRFSRRADDYCIECSTDGVSFSQMRICHMYEGADEIAFGIYACSPEASSFTAVFSDMKITECMWKAHDGQQPNE